MALEESKTKDVKIAALTEMVGKFQTKYQTLQQAELEKTSALQDLL